VPRDSHASARAVWIIDSAGRLVHGPDPSEIGRNFLRDERYTAVPTLRQLTKEIRDQDAGIGFYEYPATNGDVLPYRDLAGGGDRKRPSVESRGGRGLEVALAFPKAARGYRGLSDLALRLDPAQEQQDEHDEQHHAQ
jgi:hypothetical protein